MLNGEHLAHFQAQPASLRSSAYLFPPPLTPPPNKCIDTNLNVALQHPWHSTNCHPLCAFFVFKTSFECHFPMKSSMHPRIFVPHPCAPKTLPLWVVLSWRQRWGFTHQFNCSLEGILNKYLLNDSCYALNICTPPNLCWSINYSSVIVWSSFTWRELVPELLTDSKIQRCPNHLHKIM